MSTQRGFLTDEFSHVTLGGVKVGGGNFNQVLNRLRPGFDWFAAGCDESPLGNFGR